MTTNNDEKRNTARPPRPLKPGDWVALALKEPVANLRCYVGEVQALDERGCTITLIDWLIGSATGYDFWSPWANVLGALVATRAHDLSRYGDSAAAFQGRHDGKETPAS